MTIFGKDQRQDIVTVSIYHGISVFTPKGKNHNVVCVASSQCLVEQPFQGGNVSGVQVNRPYPRQSQARDASLTQPAEVFAIGDTHK